MVALAYKGSVTTTGTSEAIRFDKALFRQNPEFAQKTKVEAHVIGRGTMLVHVLEDESPNSDEEDPMVAAFLAFIERDVIENPDHVSPLTQEQMERSMNLTRNVRVSDDDVIPDDVTF